MPVLASRAAGRVLAVAAVLCLGTAGLAGCGGSSSGPRHAPPAAHSGGGEMDGMDGMGGMDGMDMGGTGDDMPGLAEPSGPKFAAAVPADTGLHAEVGGYAFVAGAATRTAGVAAPFTFHITGPDGRPVTRFQPYEGRLLVFYLIRSDLAGFRQLTASMRDDGTWTVALPALAAGSYRAYVTFAAPDSSAGTPLTYSLSRPFTVSGAAVTDSGSSSAPSASGTATVDGYTLSLTGTPRRGADTDLAVAVAKNGRPVRQFDRVLDGYAHLTAFHSGDQAFARALSTGRSAGGSSGAGALTARIRFVEPGPWRLFVQFETSGAEHTAAFTVEVP